MTIVDMFATALSNLGRRKVRTVLTSTGVIVGILTIVTMVSLGVGVQREIRQQFADLGLENVFVEPRSGNGDGFFTQFSVPTRENPITAEVLAGWRELPNVALVTPTISLQNVNTLLDFETGSGQSSAQPVSVIAPNSFPNPFRREVALLAGTSDLAEDGGTAVLSSALVPDTVDVRSLPGRDIAIVLQSPRGESQRFVLTVVGVVDESERDVQVAVSDLAAMKSWWYNMPDYLATQGYDAAIVRAASVADAASLVRSFRSQGFSVRSLELILDTANRAFAVINLMLASVGGLALFVASLGIINTMIMAIYERTREIGTLKAIGASRADIRGLFMIEAGMIGLMGGLIGVVAGWIVGIGLNRVIAWYIEREDLPIQATFFVTPWWLALVALAFAALVGVVAGLYPAARAARLDPLVALRYD